MPTETRSFLITKSDSSLKDKTGKVFSVPTGWENLPAGDASVTRKLKSLGPTWTVQEKKGRKAFSHGVWAAKEQIEEAITQGAVDLSYVTEIFLKMYSIKAKLVKFGHPNKQVLTQGECVLRKTLRAEPFIRLPSLFTFRLE